MPLQASKPIAQAAAIRAKARANPAFAQELRDSIANLEASRRSYRRQLDGEISTRRAKDTLERHIAELDAAITWRREQLATLNPS